MPALNLDTEGKLRLGTRLTGTRAVFDPTVVTELLQSSVIGHSNLMIEDCTPGKAYVEANQCLLRYSLRLRDVATGEVRSAVLTGRLFADTAACLAFWHERVVPLGRRVEGRQEIAGWHSPTAVFEDLRLVVYAFPIDPDLPALIDATEPSHMSELLRRLVPGSLEPNLEVESCRIDVAHYPRRNRCVLRYEVGGKVGREETSVVVYGKVSTGEAPASREEIEQLRRQLGRNRRIRVPRYVGDVAHLGLVLIEGIPGRPEIAPLIKAVAGGGREQQAQALARAVDVSAEVAAGVHSTRFRPSRARSLEQEALELKEEIEALGRVLPGEVDRLAELLSPVVTEAPGPEPTLKFCHGDFTPSQILFDGADVGLIDFDNLCRAEPALDLGQFCAYMTAAALKAQRAGQTTNELGSQLRQRFLEAYGGTAMIADVDELGERVRAYERLSLLRMTVRARRQLKTARALLALEAFEATGGTNEKVSEAKARGPLR